LNTLYLFRLLLSVHTSVGLQKFVSDIAQGVAKDVSLRSWGGQ